VEEKPRFNSVIFAFPENMASLLLEPTGFGESADEEQRIQTPFEGLSRSKSLW